MSATTDPIKAQIKNKRALLAKLKERMEDWKRLQAEVAQIPKVEADLKALERTLAILKGEEAPDSPKITAAMVIEAEKTLFGRRDSVPHVVYSVLKEAGKPLTIEQIMPLLKVKGSMAGEPTVRGAIYRNIKTGKLFKLVGRGTFGLLEWAETKG